MVTHEFGDIWVFWEENLWISGVFFNNINLTYMVCAASCWQYSHWQPATTDGESSVPSGSVTYWHKHCSLISLSSCDFQCFFRNFKFNLTSKQYPVWSLAPYSRESNGNQHWQTADPQSQFESRTGLMAWLFACNKITNMCVEKVKHWKWQSSLTIFWTIFNHISYFICMLL